MASELLTKITDDGHGNIDACLNTLLSFSDQIQEGCAYHKGEDEIETTGVLGRVSHISVYLWEDAVSAPQCFRACQ